MAPVNYRGRITRSSNKTYAASSNEEGTLPSSSKSKSCTQVQDNSIFLDTDVSKPKRQTNSSKKRASRALEETPAARPTRSKLRSVKKGSKELISSPNAKNHTSCSSVSKDIQGTSDLSNLSAKSPSEKCLGDESVVIKADLFTQPVTKKKRVDSGDSCSSELQKISSVSDSGFETESNSSSVTPLLFQGLTPSPSKKDEFEIDFSFPQNSSQICAHMWPNSKEKSKNVCHYIFNMSHGKISSVNKKAVADHQMVSHVADFEIFHHEKPFGSRITTIDWHPRRHNLFSVASKHGDLGFYRISSHSKQLETLRTFSGIGPGGYISAFKFHPVDNERFYTSTLEGKVVLGNCERGGDHVEKVLLSTGTWDFWYCAMDVSPVEDFVVASRNNGMTVMCTTSRQPIWELRLHSKKVTHVELWPRDPHILCTASLDHTVRLWDLRMLREVQGKVKPLETLPHERGINSAYFSLTDGARLLTTDQHDEIRVYRAPFWHLEKTIPHPHRFFRHMTPHKAMWHPVVDKVVCGRYPGDPSHPEYGLERTIDIFDAATGHMHCELKDPAFNGLVSLCKFSNTGEMLLSSMGYQFNVWWKDMKDMEDHMEEANLSSFITKEKVNVPSNKRNNSGGQSKQRPESKKMFKMSKTKM